MRRIGESWQISLEAETSQMIDKELIGKLIEIGRKEDFSALNTLFLSGELERKGSIMRQSFQPWYDIADSLAEEEIVALMKTFTIAEKKLKGWECGSVNPAGWLGRKLVERNEVLADKVAKWVVSHTDNDCLPFGRCNAKTVKEYKEKPYKEYMRNLSLIEAEEKRKRAAVERRHKRAELHKIYLQKQRKCSKQRVILLKKLDKLTPAERLNFIAKDKKRPIDYYPMKYAEVEPETIKSLKSGIRSKLIEKIGLRHKGVWKKLMGNLVGR